MIERFIQPTEFGTPKDAVLSAVTLGCLEAARTFPEGSTRYNLAAGTGIAAGAWLTSRLLRSDIYRDEQSRHSDEEFVEKTDTLGQQ